MTQSDLFAKLGAPLANPRWSWGSVRSDGAVFLRVWQDEVQKRDGSLYVRVTHRKAFEITDPDNLGYQERLNHVDRVEQGAHCYMIMCQAVDVDATPRQVADFNAVDVFPSGKIVEMNGDWWIEMRQRVPVREVML